MCDCPFQMKEGRSKAIVASIEEESSMVKTEKNIWFITEEAMKRNCKNPPYTYLMNLIIGFILLLALIGDIIFDLLNVKTWACWWSLIARGKADRSKHSFFLFAFPDSVFFWVCEIYIYMRVWLWKNKIYVCKNKKLNCSQPVYLTGLSCA